MLTLQGAHSLKRSVVVAFAMLACVLFSATAKAENIVFPLTGGSSLIAPELFGPLCCGTLVSSVQTVTITNGQPLFTLTSAVFNPGNVDCPGCLDFVYQISNINGSSDAITRLTAIDFTGWTTYVGYVNNGGSLGGPFVDGDAAPSFVDRSVGGDTIGFDFMFSNVSVLPPGSTSKVLVIQTNATNFTEGIVGVFGSTGPANLVDPFQPTGPASVPEPGSVGLIGIGLSAGIALAALVRRRRVRQSV